MSLKENDRQGLQAIASQVEKNSQANKALQPTPVRPGGFTQAWWPARLSLVVGRTNWPVCFGTEVHK